MNIQIFGTKKSFDSKKAERYFKERGIKYQFIDPDCRDKDLLALIRYIAEEDRAEKILENQKILKVPIVRNGKQAAIGYEPDIWKEWK